MPLVKTFSDSESFTAFYALGEHRGDADGAVVSSSNMVTHFLVTKEVAAELGRCPRITEARDIATPDGVFVAVPYERPVKLPDYIAAHQGLRALQHPADHIPSSQELLHSARQSTAIIDTLLWGMEPFLVDPSVITGLKAYWTNVRRSRRDGDIREIRPDAGPAGNGNLGV